MKKILLLCLVLLPAFVSAQTIDLSQRTIIQDSYDIFSVGPEGVYDDIRVDDASVTPPSASDLLVIGSGERTEIYDLRKSVLCTTTTCPYLNEQRSFTQALAFYDPASRELFLQFTSSEAPRADTRVALAGQVTSDANTYEFFNRTSAWGVTITDPAVTCDDTVHGVVYYQDSTVRPYGFATPVICTQIQGSCGDNVCNMIEDFRYCDEDCIDRTNNDFSVVGNTLQGTMTGNGQCTFEFKNTYSQDILHTSQQEFGTLERKNIELDLSALPGSGAYRVHIECEGVDVPLKNQETYRGNAQFQYCTPDKCSTEDRCISQGSRTDTQLCTAEGLVEIVGEGSACVQGQCAGELRCTDNTCSLSLWQKILRFFGL